MARAIGTNAKLYGAVESVYGTAPSSGFLQLPFASCSIDSEQALIESDLVGTGRGADTPSRDAINVNGDVVIPAQVESLGFWLHALLGDATDDDQTSHQEHEFEASGTTLPSLSLEVAHSEVPNFRMATGVVANSLSWTMNRTGLVSPTISLIGQAVAEATTSQAGTTSIIAGNRFGTFQGSIELNGSAIGYVESAEFTYSNGLEAVEVIRSGGVIDGVDPGRATMSGTLTTRFQDMALMNAATSDTDVALSFVYEIDADEKLTISVPKVRLPKARRSVEGPGGVRVTFDWQAYEAKTSGAAKLATFTLLNSTSSHN